MNIFTSAKVHPTTESLKPSEDSSGSEVDPFEKLMPILKPNDASLWEDFLEEFDCVLDEEKGKKLDVYMIDGKPLLKDATSGVGLHLITQEVMKSYG
jgi:hypothetical protein